MSLKGRCHDCLKQFPQNLMQIVAVEEKIFFVCGKCFKDYENSEGGKK